MSETERHDVVSFPIQRQEAEVLLRALVFSTPPRDPEERKLADRLLQRLKFITGIKR